MELVAGGGLSEPNEGVEFLREPFSEELDDEFVNCFGTANRDNDSSRMDEAGKRPVNDFRPTW